MEGLQNKDNFWTKGVSSAVARRSRNGEFDGDILGRNYFGVITAFIMNCYHCYDNSSFDSNNEAKRMFSFPSSFAMI